MKKDKPKEEEHIAHVELSYFGNEANIIEFKKHRDISTATIDLALALLREGNEKLKKLAVRICKVDIPLGKGSMEIYNTRLTVSFSISSLSKGDLAKLIKEKERPFLD